jgi:hypothetical protein
MALAGASGTVVESYEYDAWGNPTVCDAAGSEISNGQSQIGNRCLWQGRESCRAGMVADLPAVRAFLQKCLNRFGMMPEELRRLPKSAPVKMLIASLL